MIWKTCPPKDGRTLRVVILARSSDHVSHSLDDQVSGLKAWLMERIESPAEVLIVSGSGNLMEEQVVAKFHELVAPPSFDLVICEDLSRVSRRVRPDLLVSCVILGTRFIALNDGFDSASEQ